MKQIKHLIALLFFIMIQVSSNAQCAMCKATAESNSEVGGGLNAGIEYILVFPYILLGLFAILVFKGKLKKFWKDLTGKDKGEKDVYTAKDWY